ncbi:GNAT family N-acetyltransferase [Actinokineospora guangxiensis]|uniref:GNAT family N-acetyltransferase n=1 Tax=Actinokineospora guangxiensis TaxID=1490288 RepID=A0ABW0EVQ7_9PSEU
MGTIRRAHEPDRAALRALAARAGADSPTESLWKQYKLFGKRGPRAFFTRAALDTTTAKLRRHPTADGFHDPRRPAHLHINLAPEARGTGAELVTRWQDHLRTTGTGCHLQTVVENPRAVRFLGKCGFTPHGDTPAIPGIRWQGGKLHQLTMVWTP